MRYKSVMVIQRGGPECLQVVENDFRPPNPGEVRIRILVTPVCRDDVAVRVGNRPFLPKVPFVPGYSMLGVVDELGEGVTAFEIGERVAALTQLGGYAEYIYLEAEQLVHVPRSVDPAEASVLTLNYLVAYQILHRVVTAKPGETALVVGASGGVGTAFLHLGSLAGLKLYGLASSSKHAALSEMGAMPIDYHDRTFVDEIIKAQPGGMDYVFNGMGEEYFEPGLAVLRRGGVLVHYGGPQSARHLLLLIAKLLFYNLLPNGKSIRGYGTHRVGLDLLKEDWTALFRLLEGRKIRPIVAAKFPILEAAEANAALESGQVTGNIVLMAPELLS